MKHRYFYILLMLLAAVSCSIVIDEPAVQDVIEDTRIEQGVFDIIVNARLADESDDPQTKVTISQVDETHYNMSWSASGETAKLVESRRSTYNTKSYDSSEAVLSANGTMAFSFSSIESYGAQAEGFGYDIIYPKTAYVSGSALDVFLNLPAAQTPLATSPDPAAALLCGRVGVFAEQPTTPINAEFTHLAAYGKMNLRGIPAEETVTSIEITSEDNDLAGQLTYGAWGGTVKSYSKTTGHTITLDGANLTADPAGFDVWFACKPFTLAAGSTLVVSITTSANVYTCALKAKADMAFEKGIVTSFPATPNRYVVTFESNGGSVVAPAMVKSGQTAAEPTAPTKAGSLAEGLYLGDIEDAENGAAFAGWFTDPGCTSAYDFATPVTGNVTLYAKWEDRQPIDLSGYPENTGAWNAGNHYPYRGLSYVNAQVLGEETHYTIIMNGNCTVWSGDVTLNNANAVVRIIGKTSERTISRNGCYTCFKVTAGTLIFGKNLKCKYTGGQNYPFADVNGAGATLVFDDGCTFDGDGCTLPASSGIINVNGSGAKFILDGGSFVNNTVSYRLVNVKNAASQFIVRDGNISGNTFNGVLFETFWGSDHDHIFVMEGGSISGNTFTTSLINIKSSTSEILIQGGEITGNTANTDAAQAAPICVTNGRLEISGVEISGNSVTSTTGTGNVAGAILIVGWANNADSNFYVNKTSGVIESNTASRSVAAESTGFKADQMLYVQKTGDAAGFKKKRDAAVADGTSFTSNPYASFWSDAASE